MPKRVGGIFYRPDDSPRLPTDLVGFVEEVARTESPAPVFVLDVARVEGAYRIVESNCMNGSRFYGAEVRAIVDAISAFQARRWPPTSDRSCASDVVHENAHVHGRARATAL